MKDLSEPTLKRPFVRRNNFYLPRYLTLLIDFVTYYSCHVCSNWGGGQCILIFSVVTSLSDRKPNIAKRKVFKVQCFTLAWLFSIRKVLKCRIAWFQNVLTTHGLRRVLAITKFREIFACNKHGWRKFAV